MNDKEWNELVLDILEELRECESGSVHTVRKLLMAVGRADLEFDKKEMEKLCDSLGIEGNANRIYMDWRMSKDDKVNPLEDREFMIYNHNATVKCPRCGGTNTARILYVKRRPAQVPQPGTAAGLKSAAAGAEPTAAAGMRPESDPELKRRIVAGKVVLSSREVMEVSLNGKMVAVNAARRCADCGKEFGRPPVIAARGSRPAEDYREAVTGVTLTMWGNYGEFTEISVQKGDAYSLVTFSEDPEGSEKKKEKVDNRRFRALVLELFSQIDLQDWSRSYDSPMDGAHWKLRIAMTGGRQRNYHGSSVLTPYYKELVSLLMWVF